MPIPDFQSIMLPLLKHISDGQKYSNHEITDAMARHFRLTPEEQNALLPSGRQKVFSNRIAWAKAHLKIADLMIDHGVGVTTTSVYEVKRMDYDYFEDG